MIFKKPTAMDLHSSRPMLARVQRREDLKYQRLLNEQKQKIKKNLQALEAYNKSVLVYQTYLANAPVVLPQPAILEAQGDYIDSQTDYNDYLAAAPSVLSLPIPLSTPNPKLKVTRFKRYTQRRKR